MQSVLVNLPKIQISQSPKQNTKLFVNIITSSQSEKIPETHRECFNKKNSAIIYQAGKQTHYYKHDKCSKITFSQNAFVKFSQQVTKLENFIGIATDALTTHKFSRKQKKCQPLTITISKQTPNAELISILVRYRNLNVQLASGRGDVQGVPQYFEKIATQFANKHGLEITVIKGDDLLKQNFNLMHAVGRASINPPTFINIKYKGNAQNDDWVAFVGKGVCFDTGGLNIKPTSSIKDMYSDKCGAVSTLTAFMGVVQHKVPVNLTVSLGFVQNTIDGNAYRPSDIITSRKGLTVQIGNTDAEGRLVLADCMHWTQQKYKPKSLIQLSTLTGNIIMALGYQLAGLFTNSNCLRDNLINSGKKVNENSWHMPLTDIHRQMIKPSVADLTNSAGKAQCGASQAAAFLQCFVQQGVQWIHLDIAGTSFNQNAVTGFGTRLLIQFVLDLSKKKN